MSEVRGKDDQILEGIGEYKYGFHDPEDKYVFKSRRGLSREVVEQISQMKGEPQWMLDFRLQGLEHFLKRPMPTWGPSLSELNFDEIYLLRPAQREAGEILGRCAGRHQADIRPDLACPRPSASSWPAWARSTNRRWSITPSRSTSRSRA